MNDGGAYPASWSFFHRPWMKVVRGALAFALTFNGVPLPIPTWAPQPFQTIKEALGLTDLEASQIKKVYRGKVVFDADDTVQTTSIGGTINQAKSIILLSSLVESVAADQNQFFTGQFEDNDTIAIDRAGGTVFSSVGWQVVEFEDGVSVQRGISSMQSNQLTKTITMPTSLSVTKPDGSNCSPSTYPCRAVPIINTRASFTTSTQTNQLMLLPTFTDSSNMLLTRYRASGTKAIQIVWQVIEFNYDATVQTGQIGFPVATDSANQTMTNSGADPDSGGPLPTNSGALSPALTNSGASALLFPYSTAFSTAAAGHDQLYIARGAITNATTLTFTRGGTESTAGTEAVTRYYVVDLTGGDTSTTTTLVQGGTQQWTSGGGTTSWTNCDNSNAGPIIITSTSHGLSTGDMVHISGSTVGTAGNPTANGLWVITNTGANTFTLNGSTGNGGADDCTTNGTYIKAKTTTLSTAPLEHLDRMIVLVASTAPTNIGAANAARALADDMAVVADVSDTSTFYSFRSASVQAVIAAPLVADLQYFVAQFPPITLLQPNGGEVWQVGQTAPITWKHSADAAAHALTIELSLNSGGAYKTTKIATGVSAGADAYAWNDATWSTIQAAIDAADTDVTTARIRLMDTTLSASDCTKRNCDASNADFTIRGSVSATNPDCPSNLCYVGETTRTITWSKVGNLDDNGVVLLKLYKNAAFDSNLPAAVTISSTSAATPVQVTTASAHGLATNDKVWITGNSVSANNSFWTITNVDATHYTLNGSTNPGAGTGGTMQRGFTPSAGGTGYAWPSIPNNPATTFTIRTELATAATDANNGIFGVSSPNFEIRPQITVEKPIDTDQWPVGRCRTIQWTTTGDVNNVDVLYNVSGGAYTAIATNLTLGANDATHFYAGTGANGCETSNRCASGKLCYDWNPIPSNTPQSAAVKIKVMQSGSSTIFDTGPDAGDGFLSIIASVAMHSPVTTTTLRVGQAQPITIDIGGGSGLTNVAIKYTTSYSTCKDNAWANACWVTMTTPTTATGLSPVADPTTLYTWNPPDIIGTNVGIRVAEEANVDLVYDQFGPYTVKGKILMTAPTSSDTLRVGSNFSITWTPSGSIGNVYICLTPTGNDVDCTVNIVALDYPTPGFTLNASAGAYNWTNIPDQQCSTCKIKVYKTTEPDPVTGTAGVTQAFALKGNITNVQTNQSLYLIGNTATITWASSPSSWASDVRVRYSKDGTAWNDAMCTNPNPDSAVLPASTQSCTWVVPDADVIYNTMRIRVELVGDETNTKADSALFQIKGNLTLNTPNGSSVWELGGIGAITWTPLGGALGNVDLLYSIDNGQSFTGTIVGTPTVLDASAQAYNWDPIPTNAIADAKNAQFMVKIQARSDGSINSISPAFVIKAKLRTLNLSGGQTLYVGEDTPAMTWATDGTVNTVDVLYSTDGGTTWPPSGGGTIASNISNGNGLDWSLFGHIPDAIGNQVQFRVRSNAFPNDVLVTGGNLTIKGKLQISNPSGSNINASAVKVSKAGDATTNHTIQWTKSGNIANVKLFYSKDGAAFVQLAAPCNQVTASNLNCSWEVPDLISTNVKLRIEDATDNTVAYETAAFHVKGVVDLTLAESQTYTVGAGNIPITWTYRGNLGNLQILASLNSGSTWPVTVQNPIAYNNLEGSGGPKYDWTIPSQTSKLYRIKIESIADAAYVNDASQADFTVKGVLNLTAPDNEAQPLKVGDPKSITWTATGTFKVNLFYSQNGGTDYPNVIDNSATVNASDQTYPWTVPDKILGNVMKVRIVDAGNSDVVDTSTNPFTIVGKLTLGAPTGGVTCVVGSTCTIQWTPTGTWTNVRLDYTLDADTTTPTWTTIATVAAGTTTQLQTYSSWSPAADKISAQMKVRALDPANAGDVTVQSSSNNKIRGNVVVTQPNLTGIVWNKGTSQEVKWTGTGNVNPIKLEYYDGTAWQPMATLTAGQLTTNGDGVQTYTWNPIPDIKTELAKVRVTHDDTNFSSVVTDESDNTFSIRPVLTVAVPTGDIDSQGDTDLVVGTDGHVVNVTSTSTVANTVSSVKLEYSKDGGTWTTLGAGANAVTLTNGVGSYTWDNIPDAISENVVIRVTDNGNANVLDDSPVFHIAGKIQLGAMPANVPVTPKTQAITYTTTGTITSVKLYYSSDNGSNYTLISTNPHSSPGTYAPAWTTMPDALGLQYKVKATDGNSEANPYIVQDVSNQFAIKAVLDLTAPENGAVVTAETPASVTWSIGGSPTGLTDVKLEYSVNGIAGPWNPIQEACGTVDDGLAPAGAGSCSWNVPNTLTTTVKLRVSDPNNTDTINVGDGTNVEIRGFLDLTAPDGGQSWDVGSTFNIIWTKKGDWATAGKTVSLWYAPDGNSTSPTWAQIATGVAAASSPYLWYIDNTVPTSPNMKIKIEGVSYTVVNDKSNAVFTVKGQLILSAPDAAGIEMYRGGDPYSITWTKTGNITNVKLYYSTDNGSTFPNVIDDSGTVSAGNPNGSYSWTVPNSIGANRKVKIVDAGNTDVFDISTNAFKIGGTLTLNAPNGGVTCSVGTACNIQWTPTGSFPNNLTLEYALDGDSTSPTWQLITSAAAPGTDGSPTSYGSWTPTASEITTALKVRVRDPNFTGVVKTSASVNNIYGVLTLTQPEDAGLVWNKGTSQEIKWTGTGQVNPIKLEYYDGLAWQPIATLTAGQLATNGNGNQTYVWNPIPDVKTEAAKVRITHDNPSYTSVTDTSTNTFSIRPVLTVAVPTGDIDSQGLTDLVVGTNGHVVNITSTSTVANTVSSVKLEYSKSGGTWTTLGAGASAVTLTAGAGSYTWDNIPDAISENVVIRVTDNGNANVIDDSPVFHIAGKLVLEPMPANVAVNAASQAISYTRTGSVASVKLYYSSNNGSTYTLITTHTPVNAVGALETYTWLEADIPDALGLQYKIKATDSNSEAYPYVVQHESNTFAIKAVLELTAPENGVPVTAETPTAVTWTVGGNPTNFPNVKIEYSLNGGSDWTVIDETTPYCGGTNDGLAPSGAGTCDWNVPATLTTSLKVRVSDPNNADTINVGLNNAEIRGFLDLTAPDGGQSWDVGSTYNITWTKRGDWATAGKTVKLYYAADGNSTTPTWNEITTSGIAATASPYAWFIDNTVPTSPNMKIKVEGVSYTVVNDKSNAVFTVKGQLILSAPDASGIELFVGDPYSITWTKTGNITNVKLYYSTDSGTSYPNIIDDSGTVSAGNPNGSYPWTVPNKILGNIIKVRVEDANNPAVGDNSANPFEITGKLVLNAPDGGVTCVVGAACTIQWTPTGTFQNTVT
ncbi:MAG: hypothetical protein HY737_05840, partial [Candidatus Omnitrophica bacterium]|nr:hypothetical protein [Candidatus Omnitrophota bacterium]